MIKDIEEDNLPLFISFSGGETSGFMLWYLLQQYRDKREIIVLFANTGQENEETLVFVKRCAEHFKVDIKYIEAVINPKYGKGITHKVVNFETCDRDGIIFEKMILKLGIPNTENIYCTRDLKLYPMQHYLKVNGINEYHTAIGIRADEIDRVGKYYYPLVKLGITKQHVNDFWSKMPFRLELKGYQGNCKWCYKKSTRKHLTLIKENPEYYDFPKRMEEKYGNFINEKRLAKLKKEGKKIELPNRFFRNNLSVDDLVEMAKDFTDYAHDDTRDTNYQISLINGFELDVSNGCVESCEIY